MIAKINKAEIVFLKTSEIKILRLLQDNQIFMPKRMKELTLPKEAETIEEALELLHEKKTFVRHEFKITKEDFLKDYNEELSLSKRIIDLNSLENELTLKEEALKKENEDLEIWKDLSIRLSDLKDLRKLTIRKGLVNSDRLDRFEEILNNVSFDWQYLGNNGLSRSVLIVGDVIFWDKVKQDLNREKFSEIPFDLKNEIPLEITQNNSLELERINVEKQKIKEELKGLEAKVNDLKRSHDLILSEHELKMVDSENYDYLVFLEGFVPEKEKDKLISILDEAKVSYDLSITEPSESEEVPTLLYNNKVIKPFEDVTNMFGVPSYRERDPNTLMAFWYFVIFGLMFGDVVYGFLLSTIAFLFLKIKKPKGGTRAMVKVFGFCGVSSIIVGALYGSYLGFTFYPLIFKKDLIAEPMTLFYLCIGVGILHIMSGLIFKGVTLFKKGQIIGGLSEGISWALIMLGLFSYLLKMYFKIPYIEYVTYGLVSTGLILIVALGGYSKKGVFGKIFGGFSSLTGLASFMGDILSYSRILALALSGAVIGYVMNLLAGMLQSSIFGIVMSSFIYILGHVFNIVMSLLSVYVHDGRLQYIEFFGKFYEGEGELYKPLQYQLKYIDDIIK